MNHEPCQDAFVHPKFALELATLLEEATADAMTLQTLCGGVDHVRTSYTHLHKVRRKNIQ